MGYKYYNPNPLGLSVGDCTIRAISKVIERDWKTTYLGLLVQGYQMYDMPSANRGMGGPNYDMSNSYRYPMGYPMYMNDGYSRHSDKEQMKKELKEMMESSSDDQMKKSIMEILSRL